MDGARVFNYRLSVEDVTLLYLCLGTVDVQNLLDEVENSNTALEKPISKEDLELLLEDVKKDFIALQKDAISELLEDVPDSSFILNVPVWS